MTGVCLQPAMKEFSSVSFGTVRAVDDLCDGTVDHLYVVDEAQGSLKPVDQKYWAGTTFTNVEETIEQKRYREEIVFKQEEYQKKIHAEYEKGILMNFGGVERYVNALEYEKGSQVHPKLNKYDVNPIESTLFKTSYVNISEIVEGLQKDHPELAGKDIFDSEMKQAVRMFIATTYADELRGQVEDAVRSGYISLGVYTVLECSLAAVMGIALLGPLGSVAAKGGAVILAGLTIIGLELFHMKPKDLDSIDNIEFWARRMFIGEDQ